MRRVEQATARDEGEDEAQLDHADHEHLHPSRPERLDSRSGRSTTSLSRGVTRREHTIQVISPLAHQRLQLRYAA